METFTSSIHDAIGDHNKAIIRGGGTANNDELYYNTFFNVAGDNNSTWPLETELNDLPLADQDITALGDLVKYIGAKIVLSGRNGKHVLTVVKGLKQGLNGELLGIRNDNPILDTRIFQVEFPDRYLEEYATNKIAEALCSQVDK